MEIHHLQPLNPIKSKQILRKLTNSTSSEPLVEFPHVSPLSPTKHRQQTRRVPCLNLKFLTVNGGDRIFWPKDAEGRRCLAVVCLNMYIYI